MHGCSCANRKVWITYFFAFYSFFRLLLFFPPFTLFSAFPPFTLFSAFPLFRLLPFFPLFRFRFSVSAFYPYPVYTCMTKLNFVQGKNVTCLLCTNSNKTCQGIENLSRKNCSSVSFWNSILKLISDFCLKYMKKTLPSWWLMVSKCR